MLKFSILPAVLALLFLSFSGKGKAELKNDEDSKLYADLASKEALVEDGEEAELLAYTVDPLHPDLLTLQKDFIGFKEAVGHAESRGLYHLVNRFGYMGKYQFGKSALASVGVYDTREFLNNPELQEATFRAFVARNKWYMSGLIEQYSGKTIGGVLITESGILAAVHLAGPGGVRKFLKSNGTLGSADAFGTHIKHYLQLFGAYDLSGIEADKNASVNWELLASHHTISKQKRA